MQARWGVAMLLAAAVAVAGPGATALHAGEAPSDRGRPSESESPGSRAPDNPPGQEPKDEDGGTSEPGQGGQPSGGTPASDDGATGGSSTSGTSGSTGGAAPEQTEPPPPEPNLTGTRVLRSTLGPARTDGDAALALRDLQVVVTETAAAGIDGGWWVVVTAPDGDLTVTPPSMNTVGAGGVPRATEARSKDGGPLFSVTGQRSGQQYGGSYVAKGTVGIPLDGTDPDETDAGADRPVVTVLLIQ